MSTITVVGVDLAKRSFHVYGVDEGGKKVVSRSLSREKFLDFFVNLPSCLVGMEACATSGYWQRKIEECGHTVKRIHPRYVIPYLIGDKNDANDARAICEAVQRPGMRFVPNKSQEQVDIQASYRIRKGFVEDRTRAVNQARALLAENGIVLKQGIANILSQLPDIIMEESNNLSDMVRLLLNRLYEHINSLEAQIAEQESMLRTVIRNSEPARRLLKIPGIGPIGATILFVMLGTAGDFANGRAFAAYLGLVPREHSTGGKHRVLGISKKGDSYTRTVLIHGARAVLSSLQRGGKPFGEGSLHNWLSELIARRGKNKAIIALANKIARIAYSLIKTSTEYAIAI